MPDRPQIVAAATLYSQEDVRKQIDELARDQTQMSKLLGLSSRWWRRDAPDDLVQEAFRRLLKARPGTIRADKPFHQTVALFMWRQAIDWGRRAEPRNHVYGDAETIEAVTAPTSGRKPVRSSTNEEKSERKGLGALAEWRISQKRRSPEDDCHAHQVLTLLFDRIGNNTKLRDYLVARYVDDITGIELQQKLGLTTLQFENLRRRADRLLAAIRREISQ